MVRHVKKKFGVESVYCWHALHAYWSGVSPAAPGTRAYGSQITYPTPTPGENNPDHLRPVSFPAFAAAMPARGMAESSEEQCTDTHDEQSRGTVMQSSMLLI